MSEQNFDIVILGGGSGGYAAALRAVELGFTVGLVEKDKLGGTCLHRGCIPTKALLHAAEVADTAREGAQFGVKSTFESVDMSGVNAYKAAAGDPAVKTPTWEKHVLDNKQMACEDLACGDLNGDGRVDIVAVGRATHNVRIYWNEGVPK